MKLIKLEIEENDMGYTVYSDLLNEEGREREQKITIGFDHKITYWNCTCVFGSSYRFSKEAIEKGTVCCHIKYLKRILKYLKILKDESEKENVGKTEDCSVNTD